MSSRLRQAYVAAGSARQWGGCRPGYKTNADERELFPTDLALPTLQTLTARVPDQPGAQSQLRGRFGPRIGLCHRSDTSLARPEV
jgi:hypothetical protein